MNHIDAIKYIESIPMSKKDENHKTIKRLLEKLGNPQKSERFIHIAGTNGKGSTSCFLSNILVESGYKVGLFTSPYIHVFNERIQINNENIPNSILLRLTKIVKEKSDELEGEGFRYPSMFEIMTTIALLYFKEENCDLVILEAGIGGKKDTTNLIEDSLLSVITSVSYDHTDILGDTLEEIADDKSGVFRPNRATFIYPVLNEKSILKIFLKNAKSLNLSLNIVDEKNISFEYNFNKENKTQKYTYINNDNNIKMKDIELQMLGKHQITNSILALESAYYLKNLGYNKITEKTIRTGLKDAIWPGRFEILNNLPIFIIDGAHNIGGTNMLTNNLGSYFKNKKVHFIIGALKNKDFKQFLKPVLAYGESFVVYTPNSFRGLDGNVLNDYINTTGKNSVYKNTSKESIEYLISTIPKEDIICAFGTLYSVADFRKYFNKYIDNTPD